MLPIDDEEKRYALRVARENLIAFLECGTRIGHRAESPGLLQNRGSFVTLRRRNTNDLRGCRGECRPTRPLIDSLIQQTINAATDDPRFSSVRAHEVARLSLRISALGDLRPIHPHQIVLGRHGLVAVHGERSGLLLPEVALHFKLEAPEEFLSAVLRKAGLADVLLPRGELKLYAFETIAWGDEDRE
jgi:AmmeMemoRadiSam system protein A